MYYQTMNQTLQIKLPWLYIIYRSSKEVFIPYFECVAYPAKSSIFAYDSKGKFCLINYNMLNEVVRRESIEKLNISKSIYW